MTDEATGQQVRDMGEQGLLRRLQAFCPAELVGDDAAVMSVSPGRSLIVTTDVLVDGIHFSEQTTRPEDAGWRAAAANLSDLAAMGADPSGITVGLAVPGDVPAEWLERFYQGMDECLQQFGTPIVGGDVVRSPVLSVSITAFGEADPGRVIRRSTAKPGDAILVTGPHGNSRAGLELLLHPEQGQALQLSDRAFFIQAHQRPQPRLDVLPLLWNLVEDAKTLNPVTCEIAGMDSSDGLADAIVQICQASDVGARIERSQMPISPALLAWVGSETALEWSLYGGEDFELVLCLDSEMAKQFVQQLGGGAAIVGMVTAEPGILLVDKAGKFPDVRLTLDQGFQHFAAQTQ